MSSVHRQSYSCSVDGGIAISGSQDEVGAAATSIDNTYAANLTDQLVSLAFTVLALQSIFIVSDKDALIEFNSGGVNEVQTVTVIAGGGTFTLTFGGNTTSALAYNAAPSAVQTALQLLASIGVGNVSVSGPSGGPFVVTFLNTLGNTDVALMTASAASLTARNEVQTLTMNGAASGGSFQLTFGGFSTGALAWNITGAAMQTALEALTSIGAGNIAVSGAAGGPWVATFQGALAGANQALITANSSALTGFPTVFVSIAETTAGGAASVTPVQTTAGVAPSKSISLKAGVPFQWQRSPGYYAHPFSVDVTAMYLTTTAATRLRAKVLTS